jgi:hypothetical protein
MWSIAGLVSCGFVAVVIAATIYPDVVDPVFGLTYSPDKIPFDPAPADLLAQCPALANAHWTRKLWIYGEAPSRDTNYLVVGGFYAARPPAPQQLETDPTGAVIETTAAGCTLLGPAREVLQYPEGLITQPVLRSLATDLVRRYRAAFGGSKALQAVLAAQHATPSGPRDGLLRDALAAGEK